MTFCNKNMGTVEVTKKEAAYGQAIMDTDQAGQILGNIDIDNMDAEDQRLVRHAIDAVKNLNARSGNKFQEYRTDV